MPTFLKRLEDRYAPQLEHWHPASLALILSLAWILLTGLALAFGLLPSWREWRAATARLADLEARTALPSSALGDPERVHEEIAGLLRQLRENPHGLAREAMSIEHIQASLGGAGLTGSSIKIAGDEAARMRDGSRFIIETTGNYARIGTWIEHVQAEMPWLEPTRVELTRGGDIERPGEVVLRLQALLPLAPPALEETKP